MQKPVIMSTDPGIDDAVAIAIAVKNPTIDLRLIAPLSGNVPVDLATANARKLLTFLGQNVRIVPGSAQPLLRPLRVATDIHGESGMAGYDFPEPTVPVDTSVSAVAAMHEVIASSAVPVTIVAIGPLTDVALLLHLHPGDKANIDQVIVMGGSLGRGNIGVLSEFNFAVDPDAARMVFQSGVRLRVAPLDLGFQATVYPATSERIRALGPVGDMFYHLFKAYRSGSFDSGLHVYDPLAMGMLLAPELFEEVETFVAIETVSKISAGASLIDLDNLMHKPDNASVGVKVDVTKFTDWLVTEIAR